MTYILSTMIMILKTIKSWRHFQGLWGESGKPSLPSHSQRWGVGEWRWSESRRVKWFIWKYNDEQSGRCVGTSDLEAGPVSARGRSPFFTIATKDICHRSGIGDQAHNMILDNDFPKICWAFNYLPLTSDPKFIWVNFHWGHFCCERWLHWWSKGSTSLPEWAKSIYLFTCFGSTEEDHPKNSTWATTPILSLNDNFQFHIFWAPG